MVDPDIAVCEAALNTENPALDAASGESLNADVLSREREFAIQDPAQKASG